MRCVLCRVDLKLKIGAVEESRKLFPSLHPAERTGKQQNMQKGLHVECNSTSIPEDLGRFLWTACRGPVATATSLSHLLFQPPPWH